MRGKEEKENSESYPEWKKERGVDLRKREISTSFSPARNHLECSRATSSRRIKVFFWEREREREQFERCRSQKNGVSFGKFFGEQG